MNRTPILPASQKKCLAASRVPKIVPRQLGASPCRSCCLCLRQNILVYALAEDWMWWSSSEGGGVLFWFCSFWLTDNIFPDLTSQSRLSTKLFLVAGCGVSWHLHALILVLSLSETGCKNTVWKSWGRDLGIWERERYDRLYGRLGNQTTGRNAFVRCFLSSRMAALYFKWHPPLWCVFL